MLCHAKIELKYELQDIDSICEMDISKEQWKLKTKTTVKKYWSVTLLLEALQYCNILCLGIGTTHPVHVWDSLESIRLELRQGFLKSRIVTGTYIVQSIRAKFNQYQIDSTCSLCHLDDEDIIHIMLLLHSVRKGPFRIL